MSYRFVDSFQAAAAAAAAGSGWKSKPVYKPV
jgi:hypothetical protein